MEKSDENIKREAVRVAKDQGAVIGKPATEKGFKMQAEFLN